MEETELKPEALDIEITESIAINQNQSVVAKLEQLQNLGIQISIDDFGTGYSSLAYLTKYPINTLKSLESLFVELQLALRRSNCLFHYYTIKTTKFRSDCRV